MPEDKNLQILLYKSIYNKDLVIAKSSAFAQKTCDPKRAKGTLSEKKSAFSTASAKAHIAPRHTQGARGKEKKSGYASPSKKCVIVYAASLELTSIHFLSESSSLFKYLLFEKTRLNRASTPAMSFSLIFASSKIYD